MTLPTPATVAEKLETLLEKATKAPWGWRSCGEKSNDAVLGTFFAVVDNRQIGGHIEEELYNSDTGMYERIAEMGDAIAYKENDAHYADFALIAALRNSAEFLLAAVADREKLRDIVGILNEFLPTLNEMIGGVVGTSLAPHAKRLLMALEDRDSTTRVALNAALERMTDGQ